MRRSNTDIRQAIPLEKGVAIGLYRLATSAEDRTVANLFGFPRAHDLAVHLCQFAAIAGFPHGVGALGGCHLEVCPPKDHASDYHNYKGSIPAVTASGIRKSLTPTYNIPHKVVNRQEKYSTTDMDVRNDVVAMEHLKPPRVLLNLLMLLRRVPAALQTGRTAFIPKSRPATEAGHFRPITVAPVLQRLFHKALSRRLTAAVGLHFQQWVFQLVDGCAENVVLLATAIAKAKQRLRPLYMTSVYLMKAFGRVSTEAIVRGPAGCRARESLDHVLRACHRDLRARVKRHDNIGRYVAMRLHQLKWSVLWEPHDSVQGKVMKPVLVATKEDTAVIIDVQAVGTGIELVFVHQQKAAQYTVPELQRGIWYKDSAKDLLSLGLTKSDLKIMTVRCLQGGLRCF
ncbi:hypothetical protein HPB47_024385 [Ixodes persulcatus]|uniref:Uncharacterized protein n=1 Tax=Ixodes persulcatus TaxID=34615 RepID=A0AC60Q4L9_IXOPE|nr:hypothetical protein HPB47_024385 [Ixodes persulcatus]